ncbi:hypothetical protein DFH09DRAFT_412912 [Mycena vulgaris]|nr:hypothetical protein DFH09DRAFT_412912 [Mycena vulgaris]
MERLLLQRVTSASRSEIEGTSRASCYRLDACAASTSHPPSRAHAHSRRGLLPVGVPPSPQARTTKATARNAILSLWLHRPSVHGATSTPSASARPPPPALHRARAANEPLRARKHPAPATSRAAHDAFTRAERAAREARATAAAICMLHLSARSHQRAEDRGRAAPRMPMSVRVRPSPAPAYAGPRADGNGNDRAHSPLKRHGRLPLPTLHRLPHRRETSRHGTSSHTRSRRLRVPHARPPPRIHIPSRSCHPSLVSPPRIQAYGQAE